MMDTTPAAPAKPEPTFLRYTIKMESVPGAAHIAKFGGFNDQPPQLRMVEAAEVAQSHFFTYTPDFMEYRQMKMLRPDGGYYLQEIRLFFFFDGTGYGLSHDYYKKEVQWWRFGCEHKWDGVLTDEEKSKIRFTTEHGHKCSKCGFFTIFDTSD